jgi:glutathione synthase/RimK-type ligase-like ATP-grasp enzyme
MILIVSWPEDAHAAAVRAELRHRDVAAVLLDLARFPRELALAIRYDDGRRSYSLIDDGEVLALDEARVVWWRRPRPFVLHPEIAQGEHARFAYSESVEAFAGLWQSLATTWINHPTREEVASRKVHQLRVAQEVGLEIPRTLVTNDPDEARSFAAAHERGGVAYKTFLPGFHDWRETRVLRSEELADLETVRYAPVIFQEYVPLRLDLRVTVVGGEMFAAAIHSAETSYQADYRMDLDSARVEPFELPQDVRTGIERLMGRLGLVYGAIDMRLTPDGRFVFLEINPSGEWLFVEERSGQPITAAFAAQLADHHPQRRAAGSPKYEKTRLSPNQVIAEI